MTIYIALLRGINVGGKNIIKMAELKRMFEAMGLGPVQTYIQSGNVLFQSNAEEAPLRKQIEHEIEAVFGFPVIIVLRTIEELRAIAANCPFSEEAITEAEASSDAESLYVSMLLEEPAQEGIDRLDPYRSDSDDYVIKGRDVYLLFRHSTRNSKLSNNLHKLGVPATVRNWKTINKLVALANAMEG
ncbi:uncharacterized protein (DUF1697 family) [Paenibacillus castaneae]|uniref:DUF1697 domain-containing protein n=1 Tax=Paenibacillus castaneae TaxID=474957 RepID=UPI000C9C4E8B|nr:DUF1697 domain-containing protein [Paenibacillus castaneae]NIK79157.1 uncharacterized protein (DUF1697 family) [Paenibacillus castaneae]